MTRKLVAATVLCALAACSSSIEPASPEPEPVSLHPEAVAQIEALLAAKEARTPVQRKVSSHLLASPALAPESDAETLLKPDSSGRLLLDVRADVTPEVLARVEQLGGQVVRSSPQHGHLRVRLAREHVEAFAGEEAVRNVRPAMIPITRRMRRSATGFEVPSLPQAAPPLPHVGLSLALAGDRRGTRMLGDDATPNLGVAVSEGAVAHGVPRARKYFAATGAGVRVGVLSDSDHFAEYSELSGDLPPWCQPSTAATEPCNYTLPGQDGRDDPYAIGEGTAMMEILHDLAPSSQVYFATATTSEQSFAANIRALRFDYHCDVIVDDVFWLTESPFQDDVIAQAVDDVTRDGAFYFSAAGNDGAYDNGTSFSWEGDFKPGGKLATLGSGYTVHEFSRGVISNPLRSYAAPIVLQWADPGTVDDWQSANDYDLFLLDANLRRVIRSSTEVQDGHGTPFEWLPYIVPPNTRIVIAKRPGAAVRALRLFTFGYMAQTTPGTVTGHAAAAGAFAVAAVDQFAAGGGEFSAGQTTQVETFSSDGPHRVFYDGAGRLLGGGPTFASGGGELRRKPDFTAADGVQTTAPYLPVFFGTSAAAPHAGAIAALVKSALPGISRDRLRRALRDGALDVMQKGEDRNSGGGVLMAFNSLKEAGAPPAVFLEPGTVTIAAAGGGPIVPGAAGTLIVPIANGGGARAAAVRAVLSSPTPGVTITQATYSYGDIAPGAAVTNGVPFAFTLAGDARCGSLLRLDLNISFVGRGKNPTLFAFELFAGKPAQVPVVASYSGPPIPIPDNFSGDGYVRLPLTLTGVGLVSHVSVRFGGSACTNQRHAETVGLDHTWVGDLYGVLRSPAGLFVYLFSQPGGGWNNGVNFCQTVLDDSGATSIQDIRWWDAPYTGTYRPLDRLSALTADPGDGEWRLYLADVAAGDTGNLRDVSLEVTGFDCSP